MLLAIADWAIAHSQLFGAAAAGFMFGVVFAAYRQLTLERRERWRARRRALGLE